jgi:hypothetical protein
MDISVCDHGFHDFGSVGQVFTFGHAELLFLKLVSLVSLFKVLL